MAGDEKVRFCGRCKLNVYNLIGLTRQEAADLLERAEGRVCMRLWRRKDGTVLTADCPEGARVRLLRRLTMAVAAALAVVCIGLSVDARALDRKMQGWAPIRKIAEWLGVRNPEPPLGAVCPPPSRTPSP